MFTGTGPDEQSWALLEGVNSPNLLAAAYLDIRGNYSNNTTFASNTGMPNILQRVRLLQMKSQYEIYVRPLSGGISTADASASGRFARVYAYKLTARHDVPKSVHYATIGDLIEFGFTSQYATGVDPLTASAAITNPATTPFHNTLLCQHFQISKPKLFHMNDKKFSFKLKDTWPAFTFDKDWESTDDYCAFKGSQFWLLRFHGGISFGSGSPLSADMTGYPHYQSVGGLGWMRTSSYKWVQIPGATKLFHLDDHVVAPTADDANLITMTAPRVGWYSTVKT